MSSSQHFQQSSAYNAFDNIAEPGRRLQPMFMRRAKSRRGKAIVSVSVLCILLLIWGYRGSGIGIIPRTSLSPTFNTESTIEETNMHALVGAAEAPLIKLIGNHSRGLVKTSPSFHLLIPASDSNAELCKTLLSAFVLGYPSPTLINWGKKYSESEEDWAFSHTAKIRGVHEYLNSEPNMKDDDLVMIIDGYDVWFQLPPQILVARYHTMVEEANRHLKNRYGVAQGTEGHATKSQRYTQQVIFGADKICWPNPKEDAACAAVPFSTLPKDAYGPETDKDPQAFNNRPRFLNSGNVIGTVAAVRDVYAHAISKAEYGRGLMGDQLIFAEIFGEQELQRETRRIASQGTTGRWMDYLSEALGTSESPLSANLTINNITSVPGQRIEYSIGLDYESRLFQTMTHSAADIEFIAFESFSSLAHLEAAHATLHERPLFLPSDLQTADPPFTYASPGNLSYEADPEKQGLLLPYSPTLDTLPADPLDPRQPSWRSLPLATNIHSASVPALLHINGDKTLLNDWWPKMWYHPYARPLLRRFIRSTQGLNAALSAAKGGLDWWDTRGGRGGVWTDNREWMSWQEVCKDTEQSVFADGKGVFGKEEGDGRVVNEFGKVLVGDDE